jgi:putative oxidoreductase
MKNILLCTVPRILLGLIFLLGAIDGFSFIIYGSHLIHPPTSDRGLAFEAGLKAAGFLWPLMKSIELIGALCLLTNKDPGGIPLALILVVTGGMLVYQYRGNLISLAKPPVKHAA